MALRQHRLPRFWLAITLGSVAVAIAIVYGWQRQLPGRIEKVAQSGQLESCLGYGDQLAALSWLPGESTQDRARCQRQRAAQLWQQRHWDGALNLQRQLVRSTAGSDDDRRRLTLWQQSLRQQAIARYQAGDLKGALADLGALGEGNSLGDELTESWNRNRLQLQRAETLAAQARWWEALDALNRIDHPWWRSRSASVRRRLEQGISSLKGLDREHEAHGELPGGVDAQKLDRIVQQQIAAGMNEWQAFEKACKQLGGHVVDTGPETSCQL